MPILIVLTLVPTVSFYFYVLVQFWAEANRRRHHDTCAMIVPLRSVRRMEHESGIAATPEAASEYAADLGEIEPSADATVVSTYLKNRVAAFQSGTGRLGVKRSAKG
jgi:hypothetical protein